MKGFGHGCIKKGHYVRFYRYKENSISEDANTRCKSFEQWLAKGNEIQSRKPHLQAIFKRPVGRLGQRTGGLKMATENNRIKLQMVFKLKVKICKLCSL